MSMALFRSTWLAACVFIVLLLGVGGTRLGEQEEEEEDAGWACSNICVKCKKPGSYYLIVRNQTWTKVITEVLIEIGVKIALYHTPGLKELQEYAGSHAKDWIGEHVSSGVGVDVVQKGLDLQKYAEDKLSGFASNLVPIDYKGAAAEKLAKFLATQMKLDYLDVEEKVKSEVKGLVEAGYRGKWLKYLQNKTNKTRPKELEGLSVKCNRIGVVQTGQNVKPFEYNALNFAETTTHIPVDRNGVTPQAALDQASVFTHLYAGPGEGNRDESIIPELDVWRFGLDDIRKNEKYLEGGMGAAPLVGGFFRAFGGWKNVVDTFQEMNIIGDQRLPDYVIKQLNSPTGGICEGKDANGVDLGGLDYAWGQSHRESNVDKQAGLSWCTLLAESRGNDKNLYEWCNTYYDLRACIDPTRTHDVMTHEPPHDAT